MLKTKKYLLILTLLFGVYTLYGQNESIKTKTVSKKAPERNISIDNEKTRLAAQYYREQKYDKATELYEQLYEASPTYANYTYYLYSLVMMKEFNEAEKLVKKQIRKNPNIPRYKVDLGYVYVSAEETEKGKKQFEEALENLAPNKVSIQNLASAFQSKRENDYAIRTYLKGRKLLNNSYPFHLELGRVYEVSEKYEEMFNEYLDLLEYDFNLINTVQNKLQNVLSDDPDNTLNEMFRKTLLRRIQQHPEGSFYSEMLLWYSVQQKDFETALIQAKALDKRYREEGNRVLSLAQLSIDNKDYDVAIKAYEYILSKGEFNPLYETAKVEYLNAKYLKEIASFTPSYDNLLSLETDYINTLEEFGKNPVTFSLMRNLAHLQAFYLDHIDSAKSLLNEAIVMRGIPLYQRAECKLELADILLFSGEPWEATLLYSQVEKAFKHDALGHEAKFRNARLTFYIGEFEWAKVQLDVLKAATSKLIANNAMEMSLMIGDNLDYDSSYTALTIFSKAHLLVFQHRYKDAISLLDSLEGLYASHPILDDVLYAKAGIYLERGQFKEADSTLLALTTRFPYDILADNAIYQRAKLHDEQFNDQSKAMELYQTLLVDYPGSLYTVEARKRFRELRGDEIN